MIVRDMWLTSFDAPCMNTMYIDKPMRGQSLMQAIARVNRVFREEPGGLVVDYIGILQNLKNALKDYSPSDQSKTGISEEDAVAAMLGSLRKGESRIPRSRLYRRAPSGAPQERLWCPCTSY